MARPQSALNSGRTWCQINPADNRLVAGYIELTVLPELDHPAISGTLHRVQRT
jgi:hypothetical protein